MQERYPNLIQQQKLRSQFKLLPTSATYTTRRNKNSQTFLEQSHTATFTLHLLARETFTIGVGNPSKPFLICRSSRVSRLCYIHLSFSFSLHPSYYQRFSSSLYPVHLFPVSGVWWRVRGRFARQDRCIRFPMVVAYVLGRR